VNLLERRVKFARCLPSAWALLRVRVSQTGLKRRGMTKAMIALWLHDWYSLNDGLRNCSEAEAKEMLEAEQAGLNRARFAKRIHSRLNRLRGERERAELSGGTAS
jgi:hypothetical protein